ncbi:xanthine dehydrogenase family protein molybdopterin-binding subunit [Sabulicella rubraurantiaca]|uniref:xanthine dehydrogenase family protein molybdopterin-binding subunit n=1 Tax=Sabulicella rubraurantiaca TaxID=2811429 RepID=UPI001A957B15|nr:molybdopterin cofactor-binding domain-containing protein [Sabulicella rubraurantiaca]
MNLAFHGFADDGKARLPGSLHVNRRLSRWLAFHPDGTATIRPGKVELGQGILTTLAQIAAEELGLPLPAIRIAPTVTGESPDEAVTSGSLSVQECGMALRHACADARALFMSVAAQSSGVPHEALRVEGGRFLAPDGAEISSYAALSDRDLLDAEASPDASPIPASARRVAGTSAPRLDLPPKLRGEPRFIHDMRLPGMLHARMIRPPRPDARLVTAPDFALREGDFLAVVAATEAEAARAAERATRLARWEGGTPLPADWTRWLEETPGERSTVAEHGEAKDGTSVLRRVFWRPFLAHGSVGTCCAVALWEAGALRVWSHSQGPYNLRTDLAKALHLPPEAVVVEHREGAGCYGHNGADDVALDAALCARAHPGRPVRALWTRAEELASAPLSPAMRVAVEVHRDDGGRITSWRSEARGNGHSGRPGRAKDPALLSAPLLPRAAPMPVSINPPLAGGGGVQRNLVPIYRVPHMKAEMVRLTEMPIRSSALRGLGALANVWAIESVMDELSEGDPVGFRLRHLDDPRAATVLLEAVDMSGFEERHKLPEGDGMGIALARYKNTGAWCAAVAHIRAEETLRCLSLHLACDMGEVINPDGALNQLEGGAIHGTSIALKEEARFDEERILSTSWDAYPVLRFSEVPRVMVKLITRPEEPPLGAGEPSVAPTIAAIANAVHQALGIRPTRMPFTPENLAKESD